MSDTYIGCSAAGADSRAPLSSELATSAAEIFKAMGHPSRLILIDALRDGERCVCELAPLVPGNLSTVSRHLSQLKHAGLVDDRREGQRIYYRLTLPCAADFLSCVAAGTRG